jgi:putative oxidoreductase
MSLRLRLLVTRTVVGGLFVGHGTQKLFGWFGGHGVEGTAQFFENIGIRPGRRNAIAVGAAEAAGGMLLMAGLFTPLAAATLSSVMLSAIRHVHASKGPWVTEGGYEYNLVLLATMFALTEAGPGPVSLDNVLGTERCGTPWAVAEVAVGALGSELMPRLNRAGASDADAGAGEASQANRAPAVTTA